MSLPQTVKICRGSQQLQVLTGINLQLTAEEVFKWLKLDVPKNRIYQIINYQML